ncbi:MAG: SpvB/TcaC N-terminal domain-containing protein, partial [Cyclobacteriaceae bacterium]
MQANNSSKKVQSVDNSLQADPSESGRNQDQQNIDSITNNNPITLPKGGGAITGMGEKFQANPVTGTGSFSVPIALSPGRNGFTPQLALSYDSGQGNSAFGLGWNIGVPSISRKTQKGLPTYRDATDEDIFLLSGFEDLVPALENTGGDWIKMVRIEGNTEIKTYRPRSEGTFARIEKHFDITTGTSFWKVVTADNITTLYGVSSASRIADPVDETNIFQWLIDYSYDEKGNIIYYQYISENKDQIPNTLTEKNRLEENNAFAWRYLKSVHYSPDKTFDPTDSTWFDTVLWHFTAVLDYGDHESASPEIIPSQTWPVRQDPYSTYRAGFEQRIYRLCRRILMFHHFQNETISTPFLVKSTNIAYDENPVATRVSQITHTCYETDETPQGYPPVNFEYSEAEIGNKVLTYDSEELQNLPGGVAGPKYQWTDLHGEGLPGVLIEDQNAWYYKRNLGDENYHRHFTAAENPEPEARLGHLRQLLRKPQPGFLAESQIYDINGNGTQDLVLTSGILKGYFPQDREGNWGAFEDFTSIPAINWQDPNLRVFDLDGDGFPDLVITEENCFTWYRSLAEDGYEAARRASKPFDEEKGPAIVFSEPLQTIFLADMSGDGLTDIVRIRNGSVCYWPNLGHGQFGHKVSLGNSPVFDRQELFEPRRIRLADVDGSGTTDIVYLHQDGIAYYPNQSGNSLADKIFISQYLPIDDLTRINVVDLLGNGTNCIVWSTPVPGNQPPSIKYIDLMGGVKPYLLTGVNNNMGSRTRVKYAPSTKFYLRDERNGTPWLTRLPFPVQVIDRV